MSTGKNKIQDPYTIQDSYKAYLLANPEGSHFYLPYSEYKDITTMFFKHLMEQVVHKSLTIHLPFSLGYISVVKHRPVYKSIKNMVIDWDKSKAQNTHVREFNQHSNGCVYKFKWDRRFCFTVNKTVYAFTPSRANKREVARLIKNRLNDYYEE